MYIRTDFLSFISSVCLLCFHSTPVFSVQLKEIINGFEPFSPLMTWKVQQNNAQFGGGGRERNVDIREEMNFGIYS
jgi:hypothetical protein